MWRQAGAVFFNAKILERGFNLKEFYIKSYYCGSWLLMCGVEPKRIETTPKNYRIFFYDETDEIRKLINEFYENKELQQYVKNCSEFKKLMYSAA